MAADRRGKAPLTVPAPACSAMSEASPRHLPAPQNRTFLTPFKLPDQSHLLNIPRMVSQERKPPSTSPGRGHLQNDLLIPLVQRGHGPPAPTLNPPDEVGLNGGLPLLLTSHLSTVTSRQSHLRARVTKVNHMEMKVTVGWSRNKKEEMEDRTGWEDKENKKGHWHFSHYLE